MYVGTIGTNNNKLNFQERSYIKWNVISFNLIILILAEHLISFVCVYVLNVIVVMCGSSN